MAVKPQDSKQRLKEKKVEQRNIILNRISDKIKRKYNKLHKI